MEGENSDSSHSSEPNESPLANTQAQNDTNNVQKSDTILARAPEIDEKTGTRQLSSMEWFAKAGWSSNPFTFTILPELFVGYAEQTARLLSAVEEKHKIILMVGPTGSGKTTTLKWMSSHLPKNYDYIYIGKPPKHTEEFVQIFNEKYKSFLPFFRIKNMYQIPDFLGKKIGKKHLVIMYDEAQESSIDILEWLRVLGDQVDSMSIVLSGLPSFENMLEKLETLRRRIVVKIGLLSLTKEETKNLIRKRIRNVGGTGEEFTDDAMEYAYQKTGGFPREILRTCNDMIYQAMSEGKMSITADHVDEEKEEELAPPLRVMGEMTPMQKEVMEMLIKPLTPGQIADTMDLQKYKSRQHAVRSVNNILKRLMEDGMVERRRTDRAFVYQLKSHMKNLVVKS